MRPHPHLADRGTPVDLDPRKLFDYVYEPVEPVMQIITGADTITSPTSAFTYICSLDITVLPVRAASWRLPVGAIVLHTYTNTYGKRRVDALRVTGPDALELLDDAAADDIDVRQRDWRNWLWSTYGGTPVPMGPGAMYGPVDAVPEAQDR